MKSALFLAAETLCVLAALLGVALVHIPAALILGGTLGVLALERRQAVRPPTATGKEPQR